MTLRDQETMNMHALTPHEAEHESDPDARVRNQLAAMLYYLSGASQLPGLRRATALWDELAPVLTQLAGGRPGVLIGRLHELLGGPHEALTNRVERLHLHRNGHVVTLHVLALWMALGGAFDMLVEGAWQQRSVEASPAGGIDPATLETLDRLRDAHEAKAQ